MYGMSNPIVFYPSAAALIIFAVFAIRCRNIFHSLLSAMVVFFLAGLFFYVMGSEYNAVIQIAVYGLAVPVILGVAIMFTNLKKQKFNSDKISKMDFVMFLTSGIFILSIVYLFLISNTVVPIEFQLEDAVQASLVTIYNFAQAIFVKYVWAFELVSLILTILAAGLTIWSRKSYNKEGSEE